MYHIYRLLPDILAPRDNRIHIDPETRKCCQESLIGFFSQLVISNLPEINTNSPICIKKSWLFQLNLLLMPMSQGVSTR